VVKAHADIRGNFMVTASNDIGVGKTGDFW